MASRQDDRPRAEGRAAYRAFVPITTRWMDNDAYGHVNNVVYYSFFDTAVNQWLIEQGLLDIKTSPIIGIVAATSCDYFGFIAFPDRVTAGIRVTRIGSSSVSYEIGLFREDDGLAAAQGRFVHVYVDRTDNRPTKLPAPLETALRAIAI